MENLSNTNPVPEPVLSPVSAPISTQQNNRSWLILFFTFLILLLLASTGYLYYQNQQLKSTLVTYKAQSAPTPSITSDPTANWKTYTNTKYGFSIKHPAPDPNDSTEKYNTYTDDLIEVNGLDSLIIRVEPVFTKDDPITWWRTQKIDSYSQKSSTCFSEGTTEIIKSLYEPDKNVVDFGRKVVVLDGLQSAESKIGSCPEPGTVRIILISLDGKLLRITYTWSSMSEQILSTFKFLGQDEISNWKVYTDPAKTYSVKYPETWTTQVKCNGGIPNDTYICLKSSNLEQNPVPAVQKGELVTIDSKPDGSYFIANGPISDFCKETDMNRYKSCNEVVINGIKMIKKVWGNFSFIDVAILDASSTPKVAVRLEYPYPTGYTGVTFDKILSTFQFTQ